MTEFEDKVIELLTNILKRLDNPWDTSHIPHGYDDKDFKEVAKKVIKQSEEKRKLNERNDS